MIQRKVVDVTLHRFDVALSFPGEYRSYVEQVAANLAKALGPNACFYDRNYRAQLAVPNSDVLLQEIYRERSELVVVFICREYEEKKWCGIEWRKIRERVSEGGSTGIMYVRLDLGEVKGMTTLDGYVDAREESPKSIASLILEQLQVVKSRREENFEWSEFLAGHEKLGTEGRYAREFEPKPNRKLIAAVEALWKSVKICQDTYLGAMTTLYVLTARELDDLFQGRRDWKGELAYMLEEYRDDSFFISKIAEINKPLTGVEELYVSKRLWELYQRILQVHGRIGVLLQQSFSNGSYVDWRKDKATLTLLSQYLDDKRLTAATTRTLGGMREVVDWFVNEFLNEARSQLEIK
ncbi:MAG: TIR domain-containing protein [Gammaproteobacteria bacterium]|nr:TIR domain-containing protein [Gammaproteobacteria bacterium]MDE0252472.1 TIR domain-containing protein [Gammaproteobacteria bacterium]MDE0402419.1 TIR domain-containing protein [Gammaproteobacteria bacterium]